MQPLFRRLMSACLLVFSTLALAPPIHAVEWMRSDIHGVDIGSPALADVALHASHANVESGEPLPFWLQLLITILTGLAVELFSEDEIEQMMIQIEDCVDRGGEPVHNQTTHTEIDQSGDSTVVVDESWFRCELPELAPWGTGKGT